MEATLGWGSDVLVRNAVVLTAVSLAVGLLGGFVGLALGTMRLPAMLLMGIGAPTAGGHQHSSQQHQLDIRRHQARARRAD